MTLEGMRIVVDCAHGAAYKSTPCVLRELGAEVIVYGNQPDGMNINKDCGSMHPEADVPESLRNIAPTSALRMMAMRTASCCATRPATLIDGDDIMAIAALDMLDARHARRKNARRHGHEQRRA